jgi:hypothetical protein
VKAASSVRVVTTTLPGRIRQAGMFKRIEFDNWD